MQPNLVGGSDGRTLREIELSLKSDVLIQHGDEGFRLECVVSNAVDSVVDLLLTARNPRFRSTSEFVEDVLRLRLCVQALEDDFAICLIRNYWPKTPAAAFVHWVNDSALELIYDFGVARYRECIECESIVDQERDDILWETPASSKRARSWKKEALEQLVDEFFPPRSEFPDWQIVREWFIIESQFKDELRRAGGKVRALVPNDCTDLLNHEQAAAIAEVSAKTIRDWISTRKLTGFGATRKVSESELRDRLRYIQQRRPRIKKRLART